MTSNEPTEITRDLSSEEGTPPPGGWVARPRLRCPKCGGSLTERSLVPGAAVAEAQEDEEPFFALEVKRYYHCRKNGTDPECDFRHLAMERPARWDQAMVRKFRYDKGPGEKLEPFNFAKLCDSIAIADGGRSARNGNAVRNRRCESLGRDVLHLLERQKKIGSPTNWTIDSEAIGNAVLEVLRSRGLAAMWIRYSLVFYNLDKMDYEELMEQLATSWGDTKSGTKGKSARGGR